MSQNRIEIFINVDLSKLSMPLIFSVFQLEKSTRIMIVATGKKQYKESNIPSEHWRNWPSSFSMIASTSSVCLKMFNQYWPFFGKIEAWKFISDWCLFNLQPVQTLDYFHKLVETGWFRVRFQEIMIARLEYLSSGNLMRNNDDELLVYHCSQS